MIDLILTVYLWGLIPTGIFAAAVGMGKYDDIGFTFACWLLWPVTLFVVALVFSFMTVTNWGWWND